jgi:hypothetical protein
MQVSTGPTVFSAETNPYKRLTEKKKSRLLDVLGQLSNAAEAGNFLGEEEDLSSFVGGARAQKGSAPIYDPNKYYGGMYSMYGGRRVRGGLLGD